jgi:hypothetical protein
MGIGDYWWVIENEMDEIIKRNLFVWIYELMGEGFVLGGVMGFKKGVKLVNKGLFFCEWIDEEWIVGSEGI